jgi:hypothetical protein
MSSPQEHASVVKTSWYSLTFSDDEEDLPSTHQGAAFQPSSPMCNHTSEQDACSDASTDVGEDHCINDESDDESPSAQHNTKAKGYARPTFVKVDIRQRTEQLRRVVNEFCVLDFDSVDATSQESLVMRRLALLKSLWESTVYYSDGMRLEQTRLSLLGIEDRVGALDKIVSRAHYLCEARHFRSAYAVLEEAAPVLRGESSTPAPLSNEEAEAMTLRRLQKRHRQREERREQRRCERRRGHQHGVRQ